MDSFERWLNEVVQQRIASYDETAARRSAELAAERQRRGSPGELRDTMIAGIVLASHATLATRNVKHFEDIAASLAGGPHLDSEMGETMNLDRRYLFSDTSDSDDAQL